MTVDATRPSAPAEARQGHRREAPPLARDQRDGELGGPSRWRAPRSPHEAPPFAQGWRQTEGRGRGWTRARWRPGPSASAERNASVRVTKPVADWSARPAPASPIDATPIIALGPMRSATPPIPVRQNRRGQGPDEVGPKPRRSSVRPRSRESASLKVEITKVWPGAVMNIATRHPATTTTFGRTPARSPGPHGRQSLHRTLHRVWKAGALVPEARRAGPGRIRRMPRQTAYMCLRSGSPTPLREVDRYASLRGLDPRGHGPGEAPGGDRDPSPRNAPRGARGICPRQAQGGPRGAASARDRAALVPRPRPGPRGGLGDRPLL